MGTLSSSEEHFISDSPGSSSLAEMLQKQDSIRLNEETSIPLDKWGCMYVRLHVLLEINFPCSNESCAHSKPTPTHFA